MEINNLHDLVEFGIKLHKKKVPDGFVISLKCSSEQREKIYSDILDLTDNTTEYIYLKDFDTGYHSFTLLGMRFHLF